MHQNTTLSQTAFGSAIAEMQFSSDTSSKYRYGFNAKEKDDETGLQDYGFRIYNPGIGRFLSVDPISKNYPSLTPYQFASNSPISGVDLDGLEYYYAADGSFIGKVGTSNQIFVVSPFYLMEQAKKDVEAINSGAKNSFTAFFFLNANSGSIIQTSLETASKVYESIYKANINGPAVRVKASEDKGRPRHAGSTMPDNTIEIYTTNTADRKEYFNSNYFNAICTILHEKQHAEDHLSPNLYPQSVGGQNVESFRHFSIEINVINSDFFMQTSEAYKNEVLGSGYLLFQYLKGQNSALVGLSNKMNDKTLTNEERKECKVQFDKYKEIYLENVEIYKSLTGRNFEEEAVEEEKKEK